MANLYFRKRNNPLDTTSYEDAYQLTTSNDAEYPSITQSETGKILVTCISNDIVIGYSSDDEGKTWISLGTILTNASSAFILRSINSMVTHILYRDATDEKIKYNFSHDDLSTLEKASGVEVYTAVGEQQPSLVEHQNGYLIATFRNASDEIQSYYSDDGGETWQAVT